MGKIELDNYILEGYNEYNNEHKSTAILMGNDIDGRTYLGNIDYMIREIKKRRMDNRVDEFYVIFDKSKFSDPIGFISISIMDGLYEISYGILPNMRKKGHASKVLDEFTKYIFNNYEINDIYLQIKNSNEGSIKVAVKNNYTKENNTRYHRGR